MKAIIFLFILSVPTCQKSAEHYYTTGKEQRIQLDTYNAILNLKRSIHLNRTRSDAYYELAKAYGQADSILPQIQCYDTLLSWKTNQQERAELFYLKGCALYLWSEDKLACQFFKKSCELNNSTACDKWRKLCK